MKDSPVVTIYLTTKNRSHLLSRAINSVLSQSYKEWELIIINDGSVDNTKEFLNQSIKDARIKVIHNTVSRGACWGRNEALRLAKGRFITGLDDDDYFSSNRIIEFIDEWNKKESDVVCLFSGVNLLLEGGIVETRIAPRIFYYKRDLIFSNVIGNQIFTETSRLRSCGGFDESFPAWQDLECWYRLLSVGKAKNILVPTYFFENSDRDDRIRNVQKNKIKMVMKNFSRKHRLTIKEDLFLNLHLIGYDLIPSKTKLFMQLFFTTGDFDLFQNIREKYFNDFFSRLMKKIRRSICLGK